MNGRWGQMRRTTTAEVRLDRGKATGSGIARRAIRRLAANGVGCNRTSLPRASMRRKITPDESGIRGMSVKYLEAVYDHIARHSGVTHWQGREILDWYLSTKGKG